MFFSKFIGKNFAFDFMRVRFLSFAFSIFISIFSIYSVIIHQFNYGIDFVGGIAIELQTKQATDIQHIRKILHNLNIGEITIQEFGNNNNDFSIKVVEDTQEAEKKIAIIKQELGKNFNNDEIFYRKIDYVGAQVGTNMMKSGIYALFLSFGAIMLYIAIRFKWYFGIGVLVALVHDIIFSLGFMSFFQLDFNLATIAALLTIIGYSVNDSVVIYDRIRDNLKQRLNLNLPELINKSINETLTRTSLTILTTLLSSLALCIFGGEAIYSFSLLIFVGIIFGTYSSIFISAPILTLLMPSSSYKN